MPDQATAAEIADLKQGRKTCRSNLTKAANRIDQIRSLTMTDDLESELEQLVDKLEYNWSINRRLTPKIIEGIPSADTVKRTKEREKMEMGEEQLFKSKLLAV